MQLLQELGKSSSVPCLLTKLADPGIKVALLWGKAGQQALGDSESYKWRHLEDNLRTEERFQCSGERKVSGSTGGEEGNRG